MDFLLTNGYYSKNGTQSSALTNILGANGAGVQFVDVTFYPCRKESLLTQLQTMVTYIHENVDPSLRDDTVDDTPIDQNPFNTSLSFTDWRHGNVDKKDGYEMIWLMVQDDKYYNEECSWTDFTFAENCAYVQEFVDALNSTGRVGGIGTTADDWTKVMGDKKACH